MAQHWFSVTMSQLLKNLTAPESTLKKRHNDIAYRRAREAQATGFIRVAWESGEAQISADAKAKAEGTHWQCALVNPSTLRMATKMEANTPFLFET
jgi:hypothetical protein